MSGTLYLVSTPIGQLEDITLRALRTLREVRFIAAEDPSVTTSLLKHYDIATPLTTYHQLNKEEKTAIILNRLRNGEDVALVSDAGTPLIADPGAFLVSEVVKAGLRVTSVPGPSAVTAAISLAGFPCAEFVFHGLFPERTAHRQKLKTAMSQESRTSILFIPAGRLRSALNLLCPLLESRRTVLLQDLTRHNESVWRGTLGGLRQIVCGHSIERDLTLIVEGKKERKKDVAQKTR